MQTGFKKQHAAGVALALMAMALLPDSLQAGSSAKPALDDKAIFAIYDQVNGFDIDTAMLGVRRGQSEKVRALAGMVLRDHSVVRQMARGLAARLGATYEVDSLNEAAKGHQANLEKLKTVSDDGFDAAYLKYEIIFHRNAIDAVTGTLLPAIKSPELRKLVSDVLPGFRHHLAETERVAQELGVQ